ncbi:hypothetical protein [Formosa sp. 4Alg 33]|uniref:hypothetical protein n=1 Tax=Formosa sp. 4Alg 33 TaxID=3382189 RepID=UPI003D9C1E38
MKQAVVLMVVVSVFMSCKNNPKEKEDVSLHTELTKTENIEVFATTNQAVGNITFTHSGDLVYSHHPFFLPENRVMIMDAETKVAQPFPNAAWNTPRTTDDHYLSNVLGVRNDANSKWCLHSVWVKLKWPLETRCIYGMWRFLSLVVLVWDF